MLLLIMSCLIYIYFFNYNQTNLLLFTVIFTIIYSINRCYNVETFEIVNVDKKFNESYNNKLFEYGKSHNKSFFRIKPINFVFNFINNLSYNDIIENNVESFLYPYENVLGAQLTNFNHINMPKIEFINNFGIVINSNNNNVKFNVIAYGISE